MNSRNKLLLLLVTLVGLFHGQLHAAPLAAGKLKYLGGIYSGGTSNQEAGIPLYWNQVTPENGCKWGSVESTRGVYNWAAADAAYNLAKSNGLPFRFHVLLWGAQQPAWIRDLPDNEQLDAIKAWFAAVSAHFPNIDYLEVVNEGLHDKPDINWFNSYLTNVGTTDCGNYMKALGGNGASGWEWVVQAFRLARQYFPNTKLVLNDYGIINDGNATSQYVTLINLLKAENLIDVIAEQAHAFNTALPTSASTLTNNLNTLGATGLPIWITEFDIDGGTNASPNDATQLAEYQRVFPVLWEHPSVIGITTWGYRPGMWRTDQAAYLVLANGTERSAMTWLKDYLSNPGLGGANPNLRALIDAQPTGVAVSAGASANFTVVARGTPVPSYQWKKNGVAVSGATNATLALTNVQSADAGTYSVVVSNTIASVTYSATSANATLTVTGAAPAITTQPVSQAVIEANPVTFTAVVSGTPAPTYQWKKNGVDIGGATNASYTIASTSTGDAGSYTVTATNSLGSVTSDAAVLSVIVAPFGAIISITVE